MKQITLIYALLQLCIIAVFIINCAPKKSETQTLNETSSAQTAEKTTAINYAKILSGDVSDFAGTWVNINGEKIQFYADGLFVEEKDIRSIDGLKAINFKKKDNARETSLQEADGAYEWRIKEGEGMWGEEFSILYLYPAGVALDFKGLNIINDNHYRGIPANDSTKDRIVRSFSITPDAQQPDCVYYREGEAPNADTLFAQALPELVQAQTKEAFELYKKILQNENPFYENHSASSSVYINDLNIKQFAFVDMNDDGIPELVLHDTSNGDTFVLAFNGIGGVYGKNYSYRAMKNLKKDGTFDWSNSASDSGSGRLWISDWSQRTIIISGNSQESKEDVSWQTLEHEFTMNVSSFPPQI